MYELYPQYSTVYENYFFAQDERSRCAPPTLSEDEIADIRSADWFQDMRRLDNTDSHPFAGDDVSHAATSASLLIYADASVDDDQHQDVYSEDDQVDISGENDDCTPGSRPRLSLNTSWSRSDGLRNGDTGDMEADELLEIEWEFV